MALETFALRIHTKHGISHNIGFFSQERANEAKDKLSEMIRSYDKFSNKPSSSLFELYSDNKVFHSIRLEEIMSFVLLDLEHENQVRLESFMEGLRRDKEFKAKVVEAGLEDEFNNKVKIHKLVPPTTDFDNQET